VPPADDIPGQIGRYTIQRVLGTGAMGVVYLAHDPLIDRPVAIKLVRADLLGEEDRADYLARFASEARAAGRCAHANIVAIHDFATHDDSPFLVMEYVPGESLAQTIKRLGAHGPETAVALIRQVLGALGAAHAAGIVHRDVKPANMLLTADRQVKMTDFGIARLDTSSMTQLGTMVGTPRYMSPEQVRGDPVDHRTDLFSAGVVLHELLTGRPPFDGGSVVAITQQILGGPVPDVREVNPAVPESLASVVRMALERQRDRRFQTAVEMADAITVGMNGTLGEDRTVLARASGGSLSEDELRRAERALAEYIGPIAKIMVKRAALGAPSVDALWRTLAGQIARDDERAAFLGRRLTP
jgi:serine/threonine-protein kinase